MTIIRKILSLPLKLVMYILVTAAIPFAFAVDIIEGNEINVNK